MKDGADERRMRRERGEGRKWIGRGRQEQKGRRWIGRRRGTYQCPRHAPLITLRFLGNAASLLLSRSCRDAGTCVTISSRDIGHSVFKIHFPLRMIVRLAHRNSAIFFFYRAKKERSRVGSELAWTQGTAFHGHAGVMGFYTWSRRWFRVCTPRHELGFLHSLSLSLFCLHSSSS